MIWRNTVEHCGVRNTIPDTIIAKNDSSIPQNGINRLRRF
jgi:hypothetical protein